jgi:UDP-2,4-diacetamido-2,4,6-trideoxy-beta-L-altropyranose hydrolase
MNIVFRVDASLQMGTGHVMRCLTLAQYLKANGIDVEFICRKHKGNLISKICLSGFVVHELALSKESKVDGKLSHSHWLGVMQQQDAKECKDILVKTKVDWLIVDHYALDEGWHDILRPHYYKLMVIDDLADRIFQCDVLLNQNLGTSEADYIHKVPDNCQLLLGCEFGLLRPEFAQLRDKALSKRKHTKIINNILISMGGNDSKNITYNILKKINNNMDVVVVLGQVSQHIQMIKEYVNGKSIKVIIGANNMSELMTNADLAIGAGGSTSWERCCLGLPTLLFVTADNQQKIAENLQNIGAVKITRNIKQDLSSMINNLNNWKTMSNQASKVSDGLGVKRVSEYLLRAL